MAFGTRERRLLILPLETPICQTEQDTSIHFYLWFSQLRHRLIVSTLVYAWFILRSLRANPTLFDVCDRRQGRLNPMRDAFQRSHGLAEGDVRSCISINVEPNFQDFSRVLRGAEADPLGRAVADLQGHVNVHFQPVPFAAQSDGLGGYNSGYRRHKFPFSTHGNFVIFSQLFCDLGRSASLQNQAKSSKLPFFKQINGNIRARDAFAEDWLHLHTVTDNDRAAGE